MTWEPKPPVIGPNVPLLAQYGLSQIKKELKNASKFFPHLRSDRGRGVSHDPGLREI
jgi:hypothetical protein